ncbi:MAG: response regulator, partial [Chloroflexi bacterium]|nr:response regulator [Chloroflexota bacterium]
ALEIYKQDPPDGVLLDVDMPFKDGLTALKELRELDPLARVTMLTAHGFEHVVQQAKALGALDFVVKPYRADRLIDAVDQMTGKSVASR